jgi:hypothetical protein
MELQSIVEIINVTDPVQQGVFVLLVPLQEDRVPLEVIVLLERLTQYPVQLVTIAQKAHRHP